MAPSGSSRRACAGDRLAARMVSPSRGLHMRRCTVEGCDRKHLSKGMCGMHYQRHSKNGDTKPTSTLGMPVCERVRLRSEHRPNGCVIFKGCLTERGYGHIRDGKRMRMTHIVMYEAKHGPVPEGLELDHLCRNRACWNEEHLEPVTHQVNVQRGRAGSDWASRPRRSDGTFAKAA